VRQLVKFGALKKSPAAGFHSAAVQRASVGVVNGVAMLDLCYQEDSQAAVDMNVVMTGSGKFVELQATAEKTAFDEMRSLAELLTLARNGITELIVIQKQFEKRVIVYCGTSNKGKLREFQLAAPDFELRSVEAPPPEEHGLTFEETAVDKALYYSRHATGYVFADDSGLEADALGARTRRAFRANFAGPNATDSDNNALLLGEASRR